MTRRPPAPSLAGLGLAGLGLAGLAACQVSVADVDGAFSAGPTQVHCGVDLDTSARNSIASVDTGLDRAADRGEVLDLYAHDPGGTVPLDKIEHVLADAQARGLPLVTYEDLAAGAPAGAALALSFDDSSVDAWSAMQPLLDRYGAHVTFFVTRYASLKASQKAELHQLAAAGNAIEAHTVHHLRGPDYVRDHGLAAYLADEVLPSIELLRADGYPVHAFAYPFGSRTSETDRAILDHVTLLRSVAFATLGEPSPCPR